MAARRKKEDNGGDDDVPSGNADILGEQEDADVIF
jgi:hypothetical protein